MIRIEAPTLQEAYIKATQELGCSITDLNFEVVRSDSKGFFGLFKKTAIIVATCKSVPSVNEQPQKAKAYKKIDNGDNFNSHREFKKEQKIEKPQPEQPQEAFTANIKQEEKKEKEVFYNHNHKKDRAVEGIVNNFNIDIDNEAILDNIKYELKELFKNICYDVDIVEVSFFDEKTIKIRFDGNDAALLIGKDGYRYKALSYMLFNWINPRYNYLLRLEVANFCKVKKSSFEDFVVSSK